MFSRKAFQTLHLPWKKRDDCDKQNGKPELGGLDHPLHDIVGVGGRAAGRTQDVVNEGKREENKNTTELANPVNPRLKNVIN